MLKRMGWSEGKGLGKNEQGRKEPVRAQSRPKNKGLGHQNVNFCERPSIYARYDQKPGNDEEKALKKKKVNADGDTFFEKNYGDPDEDDFGYGTFESYEGYGKGDKYEYEEWELYGAEKSTNTNHSRDRR